MLVFLLCVCNSMFADCLCENTHYKDRAKMRRLLQWRRGEVNAVYREKELIDILVAMSRKLEEYMQGMQAGEEMCSV